MKLTVRLLAVLLAAGLVALGATGLNADTGADDIIAMDADYPHKKPIVMFTHTLHATDYAKKYPKLFENGCGACHHDDSGAPLTDLTMDDDVYSCFDCHDKPGRPDKATKKKWRKEKLSRSEKAALELEFHAEALHDNCIPCHRAYKKKTKSRAAPTSCNKCHDKKKK